MIKYHYTILLFVMYLLIYKTYDKNIKNQIDEYQEPNIIESLLLKPTNVKPLETVRNE